MKTYIRTDNNQSITLVKEIASSGEGKVWQTNLNGYIAKIYHNRPSFEQVQKLEVMLANPPQEPNAHHNHISFAWCKSLLKDSKGNYVGFLMPEIKNAKELIDIYNSQRRKRLKLEIDWRFLHTTALNIASLIEAIHAKGYVLGDIKPQNILVNNRALPSIIDTDSFQVSNSQTGKVYRCLVGSEGFTPPELIGKDFATINQTEIHDRFRLATIIYHLLFSDSPFSGQWKGGGETPQPSELIRRGFWLYGQNSLIKPVERTISLNVVHTQLQQNFIRCFSYGYQNPNSRPSAKEWVSALKLAVNELSLCGKVDSHYYMRSLGKCYWCDRASSLGVEIFPATGKPKPQSSVTVPTSESKVLAATDILELVKQAGNEVTVVGEVVSIHFNRNRKILFINLNSISTSINGSISFQIIIYSEDLKNLARAKNITVEQILNWKTKYIKAKGIIELYQISDITVPQIIVHKSNQIKVISKAEADILLGVSLKSIIKPKYIANIYLKLNNLFDISKNSYEERICLILFQMFLCCISFPAIGVFYTLTVDLTKYINTEEGLLAIIGLLFFCGCLLFFIGLLIINSWFLLKNIYTEFND